MKYRYPIECSHLVCSVRRPPRGARPIAVRTQAVAAVVALGVAGWLLRPAAVQAQPFLSDDFDAATLSSQWTVVDPVGDGTVSTTGAGSGDAQLLLDVPGGPQHELWNQQNNALRAVQPLADDDFAIELKFDSDPTERYQGHGLVVEQDPSNWMRFDTYSDGNSQFVFAASTVAGQSSQRLKATFNSGVERLRVTRTGDQWTLETHARGASYVTVGSFQHGIAVATAGVFALNRVWNVNLDYTAVIDYVEIGSDPIVNEDGGSSGGGDAGVPDGGTSDAGTGDAGTGDAGTGDAGTGDAGTGDAGTGDAGTGDAGVPDGGMSDAGAGGGGGSGGGTFVSDDFDAPSLDPVWTVVDPLGDGSVATVGAGTGDALLLMTVPGGPEHDVWGTNDGLRVMQSVADTDLTLEVAFESDPSLRYQGHGLLIEESAGHWLRFDTYHNGTRQYVFAASTVGGQSSQELRVTYDSGVERLRVSRSGDQWTLEAMPPGGSYEVIGSFTHTLAVSSAGIVVFNAASSGSSPEHTAVIDFIQSAGDPLASEDGGGPPGSGGDPDAGSGDAGSG
ncbi:MAG: hypothetical protein OXR73_11900, partial [Myxococcales bacterium]|nr:hypothetical protein [Myxococcales bacterium]